MPLTRRMLLATGCAIPLAPLLPCDDAGAATGRMASRAVFAPLVGTDFLLRDGDVVHRAMLAAVRNLPREPASDGCFALDFALQGAYGAAQATYEIVHPGLPRFSALAAPSNAAGDRLAVVFNNPC